MKLTQEFQVLLYPETGIKVEVWSLESIRTCQDDWDFLAIFAIQIIPV